MKPLAIRLVKAPAMPIPITATDEILSPIILPPPAPAIIKEADRPITKQFTALPPLLSAPPPPPPPSIHSKLNPVKPPAAPVVPVQEGPIASLRKEEIDALIQGWKKIDAYTYDRDISMRLVINAEKMNPGKDDAWILEKVIWDIERDRQ